MGIDRISERASMILLKRGFTVKNISGCCFDIIARKGGRILLIKTLSDANAVSDEYAEQMKNVGRYINASPVIVAERAGQSLKDNVAYSRNGVCTLTQATFRNAVESRHPYVFSSRAGLAANINSERLKSAAEERGLSMSDISRRIGVSRRMMAKYEAGSSMTLGNAQKMYDILGHHVFEKIDIFSRRSMERHNLESPITRKYSELGFEASETRKVPFNVIARKNDELILTEVGDRANPHAASLSRIIDAENLVIYHNKRPRERDIPAMTREEFMEFEKSGELIRFIKEF